MPTGAHCDLSDLIKVVESVDVQPTVEKVLVHWWSLSLYGSYFREGVP